ncbi:MULTISPECIES: hypothetical protein [unclassified Arthrobacter]|uniref:hypothetical protein n=1 Tax=Arthrobacter sp. Leaf234 TaxID=1736303 RepID=UPI000A62316F|nr:hypothetical protein [Arthrobacter sp. Leaf234]
MTPAVSAGGSTDTLPDFEPEAFNVLVEESSAAAAWGFATDFISMLPSRIDRVYAALAGGDDREEMITALSSLEVSSIMVGALRLSATAGRALADLTRAAHPSMLLSVRLRREAQQFVSAYASFHKASTQAA